jgi:23S rRNA (cytidine1920-2'-O)/16S rRNA (cytidine1409-2'-O)-methyltransferase
MPARPNSENPPKKNRKPGKERLDVLLVANGLAVSREQAQALLLAGDVRVDGAPAGKAGAQVSVDARIELAGEGIRYASRGGLKLEGAIEEFGVGVRGKVCMDIGSSTGGFTDCMLQNGAAKVYAVDVSADQLRWNLRTDARVVMVERNARYLRPEDIGEQIDIVTVDVSFISVAKVLPAIVPLAGPEADFLILVKPQFELEKRDIGKGGIVRDVALHRKAIDRVAAAAVESGLHVEGERPSRVKGAEGNQEYFLHARRAS